MVASFTFSFKVSIVSSALTTTSDKLQNSLERKIISEQGLVPNSIPSVCLLPFSEATLTAASRLKIPLSPDLESYNDLHSFKNIPISGVSVYIAELFASALCGSVSHHLPVFAALILSSDKLEREINAERLTPPTTTTSAILQIIS